MQPRDRLTAKEIQVAALVWQGLTNKDIAAVLRTSEPVVRTICAQRSTNWECGRGWNSRSTWRATAAPPGQRHSGAPRWNRCRRGARLRPGEACRSRTEKRRQPRPLRDILGPATAEVEVTFYALVLSSQSKTVCSRSRLPGN